MTEKLRLLMLLLGMASCLAAMWPRPLPDISVHTGDAVGILDLAHGERLVFQSGDVGLIRGGSPLLTPEQWTHYSKDTGWFQVDGGHVRYVINGHEVTEDEYARENWNRK